MGGGKAHRWFLKRRNGRAPRRPPAGMNSVAGLADHAGPGLQLGELLLGRLAAFGIVLGLRVHQGLEGLDLPRSEEHTSELQSLMRISYAVFCLKKKIKSSTSHQNQ